MGVGDICNKYPTAELLARYLYEGETENGYDDWLEFSSCYRVGDRLFVERYDSRNEECEDSPEANYVEVTAEEMLDEVIQLRDCNWKYVYERPDELEKIARNTGISELIEAFLNKSKAAKDKGEER